MVTMLHRSTLILCLIDKSAICSVLRSCWDGNTLYVCMSCDYVHNWYMTIALCRSTNNPIQLCHTVHATVVCMWADWASSVAETVAWWLAVYIPLDVATTTWTQTLSLFTLNCETIADSLRFPFDYSFACIVYTLLYWCCYGDTSDESSFQMHFCQALVTSVSGDPQREEAIIPYT